MTTTVIKILATVYILFYFSLTLDAIWPLWSSQLWESDAASFAASAGLLNALVLLRLLTTAIRITAPFGVVVSVAAAIVCWNPWIQHLVQTRVEDWCRLRKASRELWQRYPVLLECFDEFDFDEEFHRMAELNPHMRLAIRLAIEAKVEPQFQRIDDSELNRRCVQEWIARFATTQNVRRTHLVHALPVATQLVFMRTKHEIAAEEFNTLYGKLMVGPRAVRKATK